MEQSPAVDHDKYEQRDGVHGSRDARGGYSFDHSSSQHGYEASEENDKYELGNDIENDNNSDDGISYDHYSEVLVENQRGKLPDDASHHHRRRHYHHGHHGRFHHTHFHKQQSLASLRGIHWFCWKCNRSCGHPRKTTLPQWLSCKQKHTKTAW